MFAISVGVLVLIFGTCLLGNFWSLASRIFASVSDFVNPGSATVNTFRAIGAGMILIGFFWIATALTEFR